MSGGDHSLRAFAALAWTAMLLALVPSSAGASVEIGQAPPTAGTPISCTFEPVEAFNTSVFSGSDYVVPPGGGVITSWRHQAAASTAPVSMRIYSPQNAGQWRSEAEATMTPTANALNTAAARIPVEAGWRIGLIGGGGNWCMNDTELEPTNVPDTHNLLLAVVPLGTTAMFISTDSRRLNVAATIEPDADGDGFGDETQDQCPSGAQQQGDCTPPETTVTKKPKKKSTKKRARIEFDSSEAGSTFECALDRSGFEPCSSPKAVKAGKGKHVFQVRAIDAAQLTDPTPAQVKWRVVKKKRG
jgi:hypothetical protein